MEKILEFLQGKKTYIVMGITFVLGGLTAVGIEIPPIVYVVLGGLGLGAIKSAINKV
jgi:hypothetical protein